MYEIIGYRRQIYHIENQVYTGWMVSFCTPCISTGSDDEACGVEVFKYFINEKKFPAFSPRLNDTYDLYFNFYNGKQKLADMHKV